MVHLRHLRVCVPPQGLLSFLSTPIIHFIGDIVLIISVQLLKPELKGLISNAQEGEIFDLIERLIHTLNSPEIAIDDRHTPKLHARFLFGLLSKHRRDTTRERTRSQEPPQGELPPGSSGTYTGQPQQQGTSSSGQGYSVQPQQGGSHERQSMGQSRASSENPIVTDPVCQTEPVYPPAALPVVEVSYVPGPSSTGFDDDMFGLGALQVLKNPVYWQSMSMPGWGRHHHDSGAMTLTFLGTGSI